MYSFTIRLFDNKEEIFITKKFIVKKSQCIKNNW